jgi:hypothetical protein
MRPKSCQPAHILTALLFVLLTTTTTLAITLPPSTSDLTALNNLDPALLDARGNVKCQCEIPKGGRPVKGQFCGGCRQRTGDYLIQPARVRNVTHIYECIPGRGCSDYGYTRACDRRDEDGDRVGDGCSPFYGGDV